MTANREAMTLERRAFEKWCYERFSTPENVCAKNGDGAYRITNIQHAWLGWQAAIAHLSRDAEPVGYLIKFTDGSVTFRPHIPDGTRDSCGRRNPAPGTSYPLYTHPSEDARDAARYRWLRVHSTGPAEPWSTHSCPESLDDVVDAAMAKESGNGNG